MRIHLVAPLLGAIVGMTGCTGGFVVKQPPDAQIMFIRNTGLASAILDPEKSLPLPLPILPPEQAPTAIGPAPSVIAPKAIGDVTLANANTPPFDNFGKLVFSQGASSYNCTSEFVGDTHDVIMTAAHCVYSADSNTWNGDWRAYVKYDQGAYAAQFNWECVATYTGWAQRHWPFDYAFIKVRGSNATALGLRAGVLPAQFKSVGYPSNFFSGRQLVQVDGLKGVEGGVVRMTNNPFGPGSSGGAWLEQNVAMGLNSFGRSDDPNSVWGPQFDARTLALYEFVRRGCVDEVAPSVVQAASVVKSASGEVSVQTAPSRVGPQIEYSTNSDCACAESRQASLRNRSLSRYVARYRVTEYGEGLVERSELISTEILPGESRPLNCTLEKIDGKCSLHRSTQLEGTRRVERVADIAGFSGIRSVTPDFCAQMCADGAPTGYCLPLGTSAKPILSPLAGFVSEVLNRPSTAGNVVSTVDEMIVGFGGDPKIVGNPCGRSAFFRANDAVSNEGMDCKVTSAPLDQSPTALKLALFTPTQARAKRHLSSGAKVSVQAVFEHQANSPVLEFSGAPNSDQLNSTFGGTVIGVLRDGAQLIVTTENGCVRGEP